MAFGIPSEEIVDAEVISETVSRPPPRGNVTNLPLEQALYAQQQGYSIDPSELAMIEKRARAISVFVKMPLFAFVALSDKVPFLVRLAAAGLGMLEVTQLARDNGYDYAPQEPS